MQNVPATGEPRPPTFRMVPTTEERLAQMGANAADTHGRLIEEVVLGTIPADTPVTRATIIGMQHDPELLRELEADLWKTSPLQMNYLQGRPFHYRDVPYPHREPEFFPGLGHGVFVTAGGRDTPTEDGDQVEDVMAEVVANLKPGDIIVCIDTEHVRRAMFRAGLLALVIVTLVFFLFGCDLHDPKMRPWLDRPWNDGL